MSTGSSGSIQREWKGFVKLRSIGNPSVGHSWVFDMSVCFIVTLIYIEKVVASGYYCVFLHALIKGY